MNLFQNKIVLIVFALGWAIMRLMKREWKFYVVLLISLVGNQYILLEYTYQTVNLQVILFTKYV